MNWGEFTGEKAKSAFRKLVKSGKAHGVLAFVGDEVAGWCSVDLKTDYSRLARSPSLGVKREGALKDESGVWSIPCFYVPRQFQDQGVASALLKSAIKFYKKAAVIEGYPIRIPKGKRSPAAFAWTGTESLFKKCGFKAAPGFEKIKSGKVLYRWVGRGS